MADSATSSGISAWMCLLILIGLVDTSHGNAVLFLKLQTFSNFQGMTKADQCCDGVRGMPCTSKCDHSFDVCVSNGRKESLKKQCPFGRLVTGAIPDRNYIQFGLTAGDQTNPLTFPIEIWPPKIFLSVDVVDVDSNLVNHRDENEDDDWDDVAHLERTIILSPNNTTKTILLRRHVQLSMEIRGECSTSYYGLQCDVYCRPEGGEADRYFCDGKGRKLCHPGWTGQNCDENTDECASSPCLHGGTCVDLINDYTCVCTHQHTGPSCGDDVNECVTESEPCVNGECVNTDGSYRCVCNSGFTGMRCEEDINECQPSPCHNGGVCSEKITHGEFYCTCPHNFTGPLCEEDIDECSPALNHPPPCQHNGSCVDTFGSFYCVCPQFWTGGYCEADVDECLGWPESSPCWKAGTRLCQNRLEGFQCLCLPGWAGEYCNVDIDECLGVEELCLNGGACVNVDGGYSCDCNPEWTGERCEIDVNECHEPGVTRCQNGGTCLNVDNGFDCQCSPFWDGQLCETDVNECETPWICSTNNTERCQNFPGSFQCVCLDGWAGVGCEMDIDECGENLNVCWNDLDREGHWPRQPGGKGGDGWPGVSNSKNIKIGVGRGGQRGDKTHNSTRVKSRGENTELSFLGVNETKGSNFVCTNSVPGYVCSCAAGWTGASCDYVIGQQETDVPTAFSATSSSSSSPMSAWAIVLLMIVMVIVVAAVCLAVIYVRRRLYRRKIELGGVSYVNDGYVDRTSTMPRSHGSHHGNNAPPVDIPHLHLSHREADRDVHNRDYSTVVKQSAQSPMADTSTGNVEVHFHYELPESVNDYDVNNDDKNDDNDDDSHKDIDDVILRPPKTPPTPKGHERSRSQTGTMYTDTSSGSGENGTDSGVESSLAETTYVTRMDLVINDGAVLRHSIQEENRYEHLPYIDAQTPVQDRQSTE